MRFITIMNDRKPQDNHLADYNVFDTETQTYYPMVSDSVAYAICDLLNMTKKNEAKLKF